MKFTKILISLVVMLLSTGVNAQRTYNSLKKTEKKLEVYTSDGRIVFTPYTSDCVEVEFIKSNEDNPPSYSLAISPQKVETKFDTTENKIEYSTPDLKVIINKSPFGISYQYNNKTLFSEEEGYFNNDTLEGFRFHITPKEKLMGCGSRVLGMNRRGNRLKLYNQASYGYETKAELMYYSLPVVISSKKYMIVFDNTAKGFADLGATEKDILQLEAIGGRMSYYVVAANNWEQLAVKYTEVTGRQPMIPRWALGNFASRMGYHTQKEVEQVVDKYINDDIPLDGIVLDLYWFGPDLKGHMGNLEWDLDSFPEPEKMMANIKKKGVKTVLITEPFILKKSGKYQECVDKQLLGFEDDGTPYIFDFYFGTTALLDIFKPQTKDWFWNIYKKHTLSGVDGWWGDLGEPEVHPDALMHVNGRADHVHNAYGHQWAKTVYEGFAKDFPKRRPVILMRSGFVGSQRYGLVPWTGDVSRSWGGLKPQVEISLQMGMQGLAYMHSDLGGFAGNYEDAELYIRWLQYGVFQPIYRTHAQEGVPAEPIFWDEKTKDMVRKFIKLRYKLMPYNYKTIHQNATKGIPMMRPLFYVDDTPGLLDKKDSYLWGDYFLVSPVVEKGAKKQKVYLPKNCVWFDYWTDKRYTGGKEINVDLTIDNIPVFVKAGAFIPEVKVFQSMNEYSSEKMTVHYYFDNSVKVSESYVYEDDGEMKEAYNQKAYEIIKLKSENTKKGLVFSFSPEGFNYKGKPETREIALIVHNFGNQPKKVSIDKTKMKGADVWHDTNKTIELKFDISNTEKVITIK